eukprot:Hpha_TRINITY_DN6362_c0_g1::TRINITY_DN6362_c0_g1_i1::g.145617::m.145617
MDSTPGGGREKKRRKSAKSKRSKTDFSTLERELAHRIDEQIRLREDIDDIRSQASVASSKAGKEGAPGATLYWSDSCPSVGTLGRESGTTPPAGGGGGLVDAAGPPAGLQDGYWDRIQRLEQLVMNGEAQRLDREASLRRQLEEKESIVRRLEHELTGGETGGTVADSPRALDPPPPSQVSSVAGSVPVPSAPRHLSKTGDSETAPPSVADARRGARAALGPTSELQSPPEADHDSPPPSGAYRPTYPAPGSPPTASWPHASQRPPNPRSPSVNTLGTAVPRGASQATVCTAVPGGREGSTMPRCCSEAGLSVATAVPPRRVESPSPIGSCPSCGCTSGTKGPVA